MEASVFQYRLRIACEPSVRLGDKRVCWLNPREIWALPGGALEQ